MASETFSGTGYLNGSLWRTDSSIMKMSGVLYSNSGSGPSYFGEAFKSDQYSRGYYNTGAIDISMQVRYSIVDYLSVPRHRAYRGRLYRLGGGPYWAATITTYGGNTPGATVASMGATIITVSPGGYVELRAEGTTISFYHNTTLLCSGTHSEFTYGHPGLFPGSNPNGFLSWQGGDYGAGGSYEDLSLFLEGNAAYFSPPKDVGSWRIGEDMTMPAQAMSIRLGKMGYGDLVWSVATDVPWLSYAPLNGTRTVEYPCQQTDLAASIEDTLATPGIKTANVTLSATGLPDKVLTYEIEFLPRRPTKHPMVCAWPSY